MFEQKPTYEALLKSYEELQLRVTRFAATEQELINVRDRLDREIELYKRLQYYVGKMLKAETDLELMQHSSEAIVDIIEIECSLIYVKDKKNAENSSIYFEGCFKEFDPLTLEKDLGLLHSFNEKHRNQVIPVDMLKQCMHLAILDSAIMKCFSEEDLGYDIFLLGGITLANAASYNPIHERHVNIFMIFAHQMQSIFANRKRHETIEAQFKKITESEIELRKLSLIATKTNSGVIIADTFGRVEWVNEAFTKISGYTLEDMKGKKPKDFLHGSETSEDKKQQLKNALSNKKDIELVIVNHRKDGVPYHNQVEIISVFDEAGNHTHFIAIQKDITQEIQSRQEILKMNSRFETITESTQTGIWEWDMLQGKTQWNHKLYQILGISEKITEHTELLEEWESTLHPDDKEAILSSLEPLKKGEKSQSRNEYRIIRKSDGEIRNCISISIAEKDENNQIIRLMGSMQDVTEQNKIQLDIRQKNEELKKTNAELDQFVYSISHDLRSPLLSIKGIISLVLKSPELKEENVKLLNMSLTSATRLDSTIQEILEYSRNARLNITQDEFNITELIQNIFDDLKFSSNTIIQLYIEENGHPMIRTDKARLGVLLKNIIGNSIKYRRSDVLPQVNVKIDVNDHQLLISIKDNGEGIPEKHIGKVFDMFYRATTTSIGTGLGLYICKEIIQKLKGNIQLQSELGFGTTVQVMIPVNN